jgi:hypothetical protein
MRRVHARAGLRQRLRPALDRPRDAHQAAREQREGGKGASVSVRARARAQVYRVCCFNASTIRQTTRVKARERQRMCARQRMCVRVRIRTVQHICCVHLGVKPVTGAAAAISNAPTTRVAHGRAMKTGAIFAQTRFVHLGARRHNSVTTSAETLGSGAGDRRRAGRTGRTIRMSD